MGLGIDFGIRFGSGFHVTHSPWLDSLHDGTICVVPIQRKSSSVTDADGRQNVLSPRDRGSAAPDENPDRLLALFAENMRFVRSSQKLSQEALADLCDLDRTYISGIERKRRNVGIRNIQRIADALKVDVRVLLDPALYKVP